MEVRKFLLALAVLVLYSLILNDVAVEASHKIYMNLQSVRAVNVNHLHRTGFHFQPKKHWINDPNGPMFYKGLYHLFYQYNPKGAVWGNIVWAHSISTDMINWKKLEPAIYPSKPFDKYGTWSGSVTILPGNKPIILYTGIIDPNNTQVQNYAVPANLSDPYLREWIKPDNNPLVVAAVDVNKTAFRDPTTAWWGRDGHWRMLVGSRRKHRGIAYLYRSRDFMKWTKSQHPIHTSANTGMWECPDFYPVSLQGENGLDTSVIEKNSKHVLKVSLDVTRFEYYTLGTYYPDKDRYVPDHTSVDGWSGLRYDYGNFYASKTFFDSRKNRRILWGWANESDTTADDVAKGWAGIQTIPRKVWLDTNGKQLVQWPIEELETLRGQKVGLSNQKLNMGDHVEIKGITAAQADVVVTFSFSSLDKAEPFDPSWDNAQDLCSRKGSTIQGGVGPFGLLTLASEKLEEYTPVFFRVFKAQDKHVILMCSDATRFAYIFLAPVFFRVFKAQDKHVILMCSDATSSSLKKGLYKPSFAGFVNVDLSDKKLSLRSLIDHSVVESYGAGGKTCITSRVYPTLAVFNNAHLYAFNNGSEPVTIDNLNAWSMNNPVMN